ncbi:hypothetical protein BGAL_0230g00130 [Botrytis galanthina]|uniref:Uncharacterized protein n=1 Tax=Botrytis galanthina TaxID=278940 RepID=A0A4S8QTY5_9HELO|nr:hypothetical protein BGAL_0230g00130 [Botrytis galanthina]
MSCWKKSKKASGALSPLDLLFGWLSNARREAALSLLSEPCPAGRRARRPAAVSALLSAPWPAGRRAKRLAAFSALLTSSSDGSRFSWPAGRRARRPAALSALLARRPAALSALLPEPCPAGRRARRPAALSALLDSSSGSRFEEPWPAGRRASSEAASFARASTSLSTAEAAREANSAWPRAVSWSNSAPAETIAA